MTEAELLELLYGAGDRYRSVRATIRTWAHAERVWAAFDQRNRLSPGGYRRHPSGDDVELPAESEHTERLWFEHPASQRTEHEWGTRITDGRQAWNVMPGQPAMVETVGEALPGPGHLVLAPAPILGGVDLEPLGETTVAGRPAIRVRAMARPGLVDWDENDDGLVPGADRYDLAVDLERGVVLRAEAFVGDEPAAVTELLEVAFDEDFPAGTFVHEPAPGERVRSLDELRARLEIEQGLTVEEAAARAGFPLWVPPGDDWTIHATRIPSDEEWPLPESVNLHCRSAAGDLTLQQVAEVTDGKTMLLLSSGGASIRADRDGTTITLSSSTLDEEQLEALAAALVRVERR